MTGRIHSIESFGTVDGPGVRMVVFTQGCPMRCQYCHNPDTWDMGGGTSMSVDEILAKYQASRSFYRNGGLTVTGGEPLVQIDFVTELFEEAKKQGIHTCLDTSGASCGLDDPLARQKLDRLLAATDLVMLDIKHIDSDAHRRLCGHPNQPILALARYLDEKQVPTWIRHVVVPGITFNQEQLYKLGRFIGTLNNVKALDVLAYHHMGKAKYDAMGIKYPLEGVPSLTNEEAAKAKGMILEGIRDQRRP